MSPPAEPQLRGAGIGRSLAVGAGVGFVVGLVVGGTLGRLYMRLVFLAGQDALGFETAMGALVGELTREGTVAIYAFAAIAGTAIGLAYGATRGLLPRGLRWRGAIFVTGTTAFLLGQIVRANEEDFTFLPVTLSLVLTAAAVALTALPVPWLVERLARKGPETRHPRAARVVVAVGMAGFLAYGITGVAIAYSTGPIF